VNGLESSQASARGLENGQGWVSDQVLPQTDRNVATNAPPTATIDNKTVATDARTSRTVVTTDARMFRTIVGTGSMTGKTAAKTFQTIAATGSMTGKTAAKTFRTIAATG
jgi:hypothetical protein